MKTKRGFMFFDAVVALGLLTAVAALLVVGRSAATRVARETSDRRAAVRLAERYLIDSAARAPSPTSAPSTQPAEDAKLVVSDLPTAAPTGWKWVSVRAAVRGHGGEVVGLVRSGS